MSKIMAGITTSVDGYITGPGAGRGYLDELTVIVAPVVLGGGKRLFDGFAQSLDLEHLWVRQSPSATSSTTA